MQRSLTLLPTRETAPTAPPKSASFISTQGSGFGQSSSGFGGGGTGRGGLGRFSAVSASASVAASTTAGGGSRSTIATKLALLVYGSTHGYERQQYRLHAAFEHAAAQRLQSISRGRTARQRAAAERRRREEMQLALDPRVSALTLRKRRLEARLDQVRHDMQCADAAAAAAAAAADNAAASGSGRKAEMARAQLHSRQLELEAHIRELGRAATFSAALGIQKCFARFRAVRIVARRRREREYASATRIQAAQRGHVERARYKSSSVRRSDFLLVALRACAVLLRYACALDPRYAHAFVSTCASPCAFACSRPPLLPPAPLPPLLPVTCAGGSSAPRAGDWLPPRRTRSSSSSTQSWRGWRSCTRRPPCACRRTCAGCWLAGSA
jgi:hypothetical protein